MTIEINAEFFDSVEEMFNLYLNDLSNNVDCSLLTMIRRNKRVGQIEDSWESQGPLLHAVIAHLAYLTVSPREEGKRDTKTEEEE